MSAPAGKRLYQEGVVFAAVKFAEAWNNPTLAKRLAGSLSLTEIMALVHLLDLVDHECYLEWWWARHDAVQPKDGIDE